MWVAILPIYLLYTDALLYMTILLLNLLFLDLLILNCINVIIIFCVCLDLNSLGIFDYVSLFSLPNQNIAQSWIDRLYSISTIIYCVFWAQGWDWNFSVCKEPPQPLLLNTEWLWKLAYIVELITFLNEFNLKLQGIYILSKVKTSEISIFTQICKQMYF